MSTVLLIRHGRTSANTAGVLVGALIQAKSYALPVLRACTENRRFVLAAGVSTG